MGKLETQSYPLEPNSVESDIRELIYKKEYPLQKAG